MLWLVVVWITAILCFAVCPPRISQCFKISKIVWHALHLVRLDFLTTLQFQSLFTSFLLNNKSFSKPCYSYTSYLPVESQNTLPHICPYIHLLLRQDVVIQKRCSTKSPSVYSSSVHKSKIHFNKSFSYDAPKLWNDLPLEIQTAPTLHNPVSKSDLKPVCFRSLFLLFLATRYR